MRRALLLPCAFALFAGPAQADAEQSDRALAIEASRVRADDKQAAERLTSMLVEAGTGTARDKQDLREAVIDALIRIDAAVPAAHLEPIYGQHPEPVLILLSRDPAGNRPVLLRLRNAEKNSLRRRAISLVLCRAKQPGIAADLLREVRFRFKVFVLVGKNSVVGRGGSTYLRSGNPLPRAARPVREGWPPTARYELTDEPRRGDVLLAGGRFPIDWRRASVAKGRVEYVQPLPSPRISHNEFVLACLERFVTHVPISEEPRTTVHWEGKEHFRKKVAEARKLFEIRYDMLLDSLVRTNALTEAERKTLKPRIEWVVKDMSLSGALPIPEIPRDPE